jgi:hypothetical protein
MAAGKELLLGTLNLAYECKLPIVPAELQPLLL